MGTHPSVGPAIPQLSASSVRFHVVTPPLSAAFSGFQPSSLILHGATSTAHHVQQPLAPSPLSCRMRDRDCNPVVVCFHVGSRSPHPHFQQSSAPSPCPCSRPFFLHTNDLHNGVFEGSSRTTASLGPQKRFLRTLSLTWFWFVLLVCSLFFAPRWRFGCRSFQSASVSPCLLRRRVFGSFLCHTSCRGTVKKRPCIFRTSQNEPFLQAALVVVSAIFPFFLSFLNASFPPYYPSCYGPRFGFFHTSQSAIYYFPSAN